MASGAMQLGLLSPFVASHRCLNTASVSRKHNVPGVRLRGFMNPQVRRSNGAILSNWCGVQVRRESRHPVCVCAAAATGGAGDVPLAGSDELEPSPTETPSPQEQEVCLPD